MNRIGNELHCTRYEYEFMKKKQRLNLFLLGIYVGCALLIYYAFSMVFVFAEELFLLSFGKQTQEFLRNDEIFDNLLYIFSAFLCMFTAFLIMRIPMRRISRIEMGFNKPRENTNVFSVIIIGIAMCVIANFTSYVFSALTDAVFGVVPSGETEIVSENSEFSLLGFVMSLLATAVTPAFVEEFAFRGVIMQSLRKFGDKFAVIVTAVIFAIVHGNFVQIPFAFVVGLALGYAVIRTGSIWAGVIIHFINNAWATVMMYVYNAFGEVTYSLISCFVTVVVCVFGIIFAVKLYKKDVSRGITEGAMQPSRICVLSDFGKTFFFFISPVLIIALSIFLGFAFSSFTKGY